MPAPRNRRHILIATAPEAEGFTSRRTGRPKAFVRPPNRVQHAQLLTQGLATAVREANARRAAEGVVAPPELGILVQFEAPPGVDLKLESLENKHAGIELRGVHRTRAADGEPYVETATVFIPEGKIAHFLTRFQQYAVENTEKGHPKNRELVDRIAAIHLATLRALWTDDADEFPSDDRPIWWEVWLRRDEQVLGAEVRRFEAFAGAHNLGLGFRRLAFMDRTICLVRATARQLSASLSVLSDLSELRKAKTVSAFFVDLTPAEQAGWWTIYWNG
jgi:hypothetical protein